MKQQCHISFIYLSWIVYIGGIVVYLALGRYVQAVVWLAIVPFVMRAYVKYFPSLSGMMGYGSVEDKPAAGTVASSAHVVIYTGIGCPFCPIVKNRLTTLQAKMGFQLEEIDITFKPELLMSKGIRALPVIEVGGRLSVGNATSAKLAALISGSDGV
jgi:glutaredoxin